MFKHAFFKLRCSQGPGGDGKAENDCEGTREFDG